MDVVAALEQECRLTAGAAAQLKHPGAFLGKVAEQQVIQMGHVRGFVFPAALTRVVVVVADRRLVHLPTTEVLCLSATLIIADRFPSVAVAKDGGRKSLPGPRMFYLMRANSTAP
jgi:hypothetical protein